MGGGGGERADVDDVQEKKKGTEVPRFPCSRTGLWTR